MRQSYQFLGLLVLAIGTAYVSSPLSAATIYFQDDFQSATAGTMPTDAGADLNPVGTVGSWTISENSPTYLQVWNNANPSNPTNDAGANHYASEVAASDGEGDMFATGWNAADTANKQLYVSLSVWRPSAGYAGLEIIGRGAASWASRAFDVRIGGDGGVRYYDGAAGHATSLTVAAGSWQNLVIAADMATKTGTISVGGASASFNWSNSADQQIGNIFFAPDQTGRNFFDNVTLSDTAPVPEPSTIALLMTVLVSLLAYAWRKHK
jgi:hypothetical protein